MILQYKDIFSNGEPKRIKTRITTEHSASSYGQPVLELDDGDVLNAESWVLIGYQVVSATPCSESRKTPQLLSGVRVVW